MYDKIKRTLQNYLVQNGDVLGFAEKAEIQAEIDFMSYLSGDPMRETVEKTEEKIKRLKEIIFKILNAKEDNSGNDIRLKRSEFLEVYNLGFEDNGSDDCELYGNDVTVHWHGIYCNCSDGAVAWNNIVCNIQSVIDEDDDI